MSHELPEISGTWTSDDGSVVLYRGDDLEVLPVLPTVGGIVLDPFMGSGSTAIAALETGRRFVGIEKDPDIFEQARRRISEHVSQGCLFDWKGGTT